jgi:hypothetical protein
MHTQSSYPTNGTTNESSSGDSSSIVGIAAGVGGGILLIILIVVLIVLYLRSQSKQWRNPQAPQSQYSWNAVYNTGPRNPVESKNSKSKLINSKNSDKSKRHSDGSYTYPIVADSENKQSSVSTVLWQFWLVMALVLDYIRQMGMLIHLLSCKKMSHFGSLHSRLRDYMLNLKENDFGYWSVQL